MRVRPLAGRGSGGDAPAAARSAGRKPFATSCADETRLILAADEGPPEPFGERSIAACAYALCVRGRLCGLPTPAAAAERGAASAETRRDCTAAPGVR
jgi:hypothetical protein